MGFLEGLQIWGWGLPPQSRVWRPAGDECWWGLCCGEREERTTAVLTPIAATCPATATTSRPGPILWIQSGRFIWDPCHRHLSLTNLLAYGERADIRNKQYESSVGKKVKEHFPIVSSGMKTLYVEWAWIYPLAAHVHKHQWRKNSHSYCMYSYKSPHVFCSDIHH